MSPTVNFSVVDSVVEVEVVTSIFVRVIPEPMEGLIKLVLAREIVWLGDTSRSKGLLGLTIPLLLGNSMGLAVMGGLIVILGLGRKGRTGPEGFLKGLIKGPRNSFSSLEVFLMLGPSMIDSLSSF